MALALIDVTRRFGAQLALERVSIHVRRGDCYGFIGHNGAGKTTAMRIALGLDRATAGRVVVDGFDASSHPREARARLGGLVEVPGFHPLADGPTNLRWLARLQGLGAREARDEARRLIELVGLAHAGSKPVRAYSQGMRQRLGIAQALIGSPMCVLLDEPTNGLDPEGIADVRALLRKLTGAGGLTVMISSHQLRELEGICNRVGLLHRGRLVVEAELAELLAAERGRTEVETDADLDAAELLRRLGFAPEVLPRGGLALELGERRPGEVLRALLERGVEVKRFGTEPPTLERIYLRYAHAAHVAALPARTAPAVTPAFEMATPRARRAPGFPILRAARYEIVRWTARPGVLALVALPAALAVASVANSKRAELAQRAQIASGELASVTGVNGFQAAAGALAAALPVAALVLAGLASQTLAAELARGTLRNFLLRPIRRVQASAGKALALACAVLATHAALALAATAAAGVAFGFGDVVEELVGGGQFELVSAAELWPLLRSALAATILPLAAAAAIGLGASAATRGPAGALALALGSLVFLDVTRGLARVFGLEAALPTAFVPSPLGDTSYVHYLRDRAEGVSNTSFEYGQPLVREMFDSLPAFTANEPYATAVELAARATAPDVVTPLAWIVAMFALAAILLGRRSVP